MTYHKSLTLAKLVPKFLSADITIYVVSTNDKTT